MKYMIYPTSNIEIMDDVKAFFYFYFFVRLPLLLQKRTQRPRENENASLLSIHFLMTCLELWTAEEEEENEKKKYSFVGLVMGPGKSTGRKEGKRFISLWQ